MANKPKSKSKFGSAKFLSHDPDKKQKAEIKAWTPTTDEIDSALLRLMEEDYKITLREDEFNNCFACWLVPETGHEINDGFILSGRGSTPLKALKQAIWIHYHLFDGEWSSHWEAAKAEELDD